MDAVQAEVDALCLSLRKVVGTCHRCQDSRRNETLTLRTLRLAVPVVDAFALSDHVVNSPLGRYDGDVYTAYFNHVSTSPLSACRGRVS